MPSFSTATLKQTLEQAIAHPETANLVQLWHEVEQQLAVLARDEKLRVAGMAIAQLAELHFARAQCLLGHWEDQWSSDIAPEYAEIEPVLTDEMLSSFLRQTMSLNLEAMLEDFIYTRQRTAPEDSIAGEVEKQAVLDWLEQEEKDKALAVAHDENVGEWIGWIQEWLERSPSEPTFTCLVFELQQHHPHLSRVAVWLALLLGGFHLQPAAEFYARDFSILGSAEINKAIAPS